MLILYYDFCEAKIVCYFVAGSSSGRTSAFEAEYPGSNPGPAVLEQKFRFLPVDINTH